MGNGIKTDTRELDGAEKLSDEDEAGAVPTAKTGQNQNDKKPLDETLRLPPPARAAAGFFGSGVFFMMVGVLFLISAYQTMTTTHTSFTFVLVVVGVAILLYGTGTQSAGHLDSDAGGGVKYRVAIAGGAGLLAFLIGFGIVERGPQIQRAFQVEKKYFRYLVEPTPDGISDFRNYAVTAEVNGERVASVIRGNRVEVLVPYFDSGNVVAMRGQIELFRIQDAPKQMARQSSQLRIEVKPDQVVTIEDGSYDIPLFNGPPAVVSVRADEGIDVRQSDRENIDVKGDVPPSRSVMVR